jgi:hypothetical protein
VLVDSSIMDGNDTCFSIAKHREIFLLCTSLDEIRIWVENREPKAGER